MEDNQNLCMDWDDAIEDDGQEFLILSEGDYEFTVTAMDRGRSKGTGKIPACNMATLTLSVEDGHGRTAICKTNILLYKTVEWKISQFFRCIGQKGEGEKVNMNWNAVVGATGKAHFKPRTYTGRDGNPRETNDVAYFIDAEKTTPGLPSGFKELSSDEELPFD